MKSLTPQELATFAIDLVVQIVTFLLQVWNNLIDRVGLRSLWVGVVILTALFSIVLTSMRGGQLLGGGAIGTFTQNKIHNARKNYRKSDGDE